MNTNPNTIKSMEEIIVEISSYCLLTLKLNKPIAIPKSTVLKACAKAEIIVIRKVCCLDQLNFFSNARIGIQWLGIKACKMLMVNVPIMSCEIKVIIPIAIGRKRS